MQIEILRPARFAIRAAHVEAAEGLDADECARALTIDVEVAHAKFPARLGDVGGRAAEQAARQRKPRGVRPFDGLVKVPGAHDRRRRAALPNLN